MSDIKKLKYHFLLAKERTASSFVVTMLNQSNDILSVSEETFGLYLFDKYKDLKIWNEKDLISFFSDFLLMKKKNLALFMGSEDDLKKSLMSQVGKDISVRDLIKLIYLNFYPQKSKDSLLAIIDKQIDYLFQIPELIERFPDARYVILTRDPVSNVESCVARELNGSNNVVFHAELWRTYYENVLPYINDERFLVLKYEELVSDPRRFLEKLCGHFSLIYSDEMLSIDGALDGLFESNKGRVSPEFEEEFREFHKGLFNPVSSDYNVNNKFKLNDAERLKVEFITSDVASQLGYIDHFTKIDLSPFDRIQQSKAILAKKRLLELYWRIPIEMKLWIKKNRTQKVDV